MIYRTCAPSISGFSRDAAGAPRLAAVAYRVFAPGNSRIDDQFSQRHFTDLTASFGGTYRPDLAPTGAGNTFAAMSRELVTSLGIGADSVSMALVAHATPDLDCRTAAATYLSDAFPRAPLTFSVSDQGVFAPFTAVRLAGDLMRRHQRQRALVLVLDQATLPYRTDSVLAGDAGVALLLADSGPATLPTLRLLPPMADMTDLFGELDQLTGPIVLALGPTIDEPARLPSGVKRIVRTAPGFPCTGLWAQLSQPLDAGQQVVLVERDPDTGGLGGCALGVVERRW